MLTIGGYLNIIIALLHLIGLTWAKEFFAVTGIGNEMEEAAAFHPVMPYLTTVVVTIIFFLFGLYGLSAAGKFRKLPLLKVGVYLIAGIYLLRGLGGLLYHTEGSTASLPAEIGFSAVALIIGVLYLLGGRKRFSIQ